MIGASRISLSQPLPLPGRKTTSGGLKPWPRRRVGRILSQPTDASRKNHLRYDLARRGAVLSQKGDCQVTVKVSLFKTTPSILGHLGISVNGGPSYGFYGQQSASCLVSCTGSIQVDKQQVQDSVAISVTYRQAAGLLRYIANAARNHHPTVLQEITALAFARLPSHPSGFVNRLAYLISQAPYLLI